MMPLDDGWNMNGRRPGRGAMVDFFAMVTLGIVLGLLFRWMFG